MANGRNVLAGDATFDGTIGDGRLSDLASQFWICAAAAGGTGVGASLAAVPEPAAVWLGAIGLVGAMTMWRRRTYGRNREASEQLAFRGMSDLAISATETNGVNF